MKEFTGKYGSIYINGKSVNIEKSEDEKLKQYLKMKEEERDNLIKEQNRYISEIIY